MRESMVTRTIKSTNVVAMVADILSGSIVNKEYTLAGTFEDEKSLNKALAKVANTETETAVKVIETSVQETLYGMPEQEFIRSAKVLPPRGTKTTENPEQ